MAKILVVDDEPSVLAVVSRALREDDHEVIAVSNGQTAWEIAMAERMDVVVSNGRILGHGKALTEAWRSRFPDTPILYVHDQSQVQRALFQLPADVPTLFKPFDLTALKVAVRRLLGTPLPTQPELSFLLEEQQAAARSINARGGLSATGASYALPAVAADPL